MLLMLLSTHSAGCFWPGEPDKRGIYSSVDVGMCAIDCWLLAHVGLPTTSANMEEAGFVIGQHTVS